MREKQRKLQLPEKLRWNHNEWYRRWLLRQLPSRAGSALDVGCGLGDLARQIRAGEVTAIDASARMIERASATTDEVRWIHGDVLTHDLGRYDVVTAEASLHHLPLREGLTRLAGLTRPGGTLIVIGLYLMASRADRAMELVTLPANAIVGLAKALNGTGGTPHDAEMPVVMSAPTLDEIRAAAAEIVPGARIRRHLFWRYSLVWHAPEVH
ncbi:Methyltransferase domain-containing protein [Lentzea albidocapillata subsp. violacea]|uniref:Methyltransferase domain-containing protein n=1 Tax=Lentzea albidocapillata subsp. violacea TaxID=128104 RepID=A0A1G9BEM5_9PSEU|nr:class I SAM-dependent methyltransferase [Lentzea albidocapillata]SDK37600.1 Methyltransferase domain-containing protein [Lentzea albidocapillata subsp. violacea]